MSLRRDVLTIVAFVPIAAAILFGLLRASGSDPLGASGRTMQAIVPSAVSLAPAAEVRIAGVRVGRVDRLRRRGGEAVLLLRLDPDAPPVFGDARVDIRSRTVVGENFVQIDPGTPSAGEAPPGAVIERRRSVPGTQFDEVASMFDAPTRRHLRDVLGGLGDGLGGPGGADLNRLLRGASATSAAGEPVLGALAARRLPLARLVDRLGTVTRALGSRRQDIRTLALRASAAVDVLRERRSELEQVLRDAPATIAQARRTTGRLAALSADATRPVRDLQVGLQELAPSLRRLAPTARAAGTALAELDRTAPRATRLLRRLGRATPSIAATVRPLEEVLAQVNPVAEYLSPYTRELGAFFGNLGSAVSVGDSLGQLARVAPIVSPGVLATAPKEFVQFYDRLKAIGVVSQTTGEHGFNPYPEPGGLLRPTPFRGRYPRIQPAPIPR